MALPGSQALTSMADFCASANRLPTLLAEKIGADAVNVTAPVAALAYTVVVVMFSGLKGPPDGVTVASVQSELTPLAPMRDSLRGA